MRLALFLSLTALPALAADLPQPLRDAEFRTDPEAVVLLGRDLFYDPILSGNREVSCATCHHPRFATGDGLSLGLGDGGKGLGPDRVADPENMPEARVPRNAPPLFNLGHKSLRVLFADGRIEADESREAGFRTPLEGDMPVGFDGILSAQTMFPVLSPTEMAGHYSENEISTAVRQGRFTGEDGAWARIAARVAGVPAYVDAFHAAYPETRESGLGFTDISNAIAAFMADEWRADASLFDAHLRGETTLTGAAAEGMALFYGEAGCAACHSGSLLTDQEFHAMGAPQLGPGKAESFESHARDLGRMRVTGDPADAFAFRTPMLRNVTKTGPWGHAGAHDDLRAFLRDHAEPVAGLMRYTPAAVLPELPGLDDWRVMDDQAERDAIAASVTAPSRPLSEKELDQLMAFLDALTDEASLKGKYGVPESVPSGLPVDR